MAYQSVTLATLTLLLITSCASPSPVVNTCITIKTYTPEQQSEILKAEKAVSPDSPLISPLQDWVRMRDQARACAAR